MIDRFLRLIQGVKEAMSPTKRSITAGLLIGLGATGMGRVVAQESYGSRQPAREVGAALLSPRAALFHEYVTRPRGEPFKWQRIPWLVDLPAAIRQAKAEDRPILMWVAGDSPLQRC
jgi:hypothetical protein